MVRLGLHVLLMLLAQHGYLYSFRISIKTHILDRAQSLLFLRPAQRAPRWASLFVSSFTVWNENIDEVLDLADIILDFKSYKGHHVLLFGDAYFTSIIGPNGSGKSNACAIEPIGMVQS